MIRTQITLTADQMRRLREFSRRRSQSMAAVVREAVERILAEEEQRRNLRRALEAVREGSGRSGTGDIARRHDEYLAEDFAP